MKKGVIDEWIDERFGGVNPKAVNRIRLASELFNAFDRKSIWIREALAKEIGIDISKELKEKNFKQWRNNRRRFYNVLHPLLHTIIQADKYKKRVFYKLNRGMLSAFHTGIEKAFAYRYGKWDETVLSEALAEKEIEETEEAVEEPEGGEPAKEEDVESNE